MESADDNSYPPLFRQLMSNPQPPSRPVGNSGHSTVQESNLIPVIHLSRLDPEKLESACRDWGVFRLVDHGVPPALLTRLRGHARKLFSLPFDSKQALFRSPASYFWGTPVLTPAGRALSGNSQSVNWVEGLNVPLGQQLSLLGDDGDDGHGDGATALVSLRSLLREYEAHLVRIAESLFRVVTVKLGLDRTLSASYLNSSSDATESRGFVRLYRYPRCLNSNGADDERLGMEVHTDSSIFSILCVDEVQGLEFFKDGRWIQVQPDPDALVINVGDMLQALSDDEYKSVRHRVKLNRHRDRLTIGYFVFPDKGSVIRAPKYRPFTYADFQAQVQQDVKTLGFKVGLDRFKLERQTA